MTRYTPAGTPSSSKAKWMTPASRLRRSARSRQQTLTQIDFVKRHLPSDEVDLEFEDAENYSADVGNDNRVTATTAAATADHDDDNDDDNGYEIRPPTARKRRRGGLRELPQDVVHSPPGKADFDTPSTAKKRLSSVDVDDAQCLPGKGSSKKKRKVDGAAMHRSPRVSSPPAVTVAAAEYATPPPRTPQRKRVASSSELSTERPLRSTKARQTATYYPASSSALKEKSTNELLRSTNDPGRRRRRTFREPAKLEIKDSYAPDSEEAADFGPSQQFLPSSPLQQHSRTLDNSTTPKVTTPVRRGARFTTAAGACLEVPDSRGSRSASPRQRHGSPDVLEYHGKLEIEDSEQEDSDVLDVAFDHPLEPETQTSLSRLDSSTEDENTEQVAEAVGSPRQVLESSRLESSNDTTDGAGNDSSVSTAVKEEPQDYYEPALPTGDKAKPVPQVFQSSPVPPGASPERRTTPATGYSSDKRGPPSSAYNTQSRSNETQVASLKSIKEPESQINRQSLAGISSLRHGSSQQLQREVPAEIPDSRSTSVLDTPLRLGHRSTQDGDGIVERRAPDSLVLVSGDLPTDPVSVQHISSLPQHPSSPPETALVDDDNNVNEQLQLQDDLTTESQLLPESLMESFLPMPPPLFSGALDEWEYNN